MKDFVQQYVKTLITDLTTTTNAITSDTWERVVDCLYSCVGCIYVTGVGKSSIIAHKFAASLVSVGINSRYVHATEALHGESGIISSSDIIVCLSHSGETAEVISVVTLLQAQDRCDTVISIVSNSRSTLAELSDLVLVTSVTNDKTILTYLPTSSTTLTLIVCDIIVLGLITRTGLTIEEFKQSHPGGILGRTHLVVQDVIIPILAAPLIPINMCFNEVVHAISKYKLGCVLVVGEDSASLRGIITDGDIRRAIVHYGLELTSITAKDIMTSMPQSCRLHTGMDEALMLMEDHNITSLPVVDDRNQILGIIHMHTILKKYKELNETNR